MNPYFGQRTTSMFGYVSTSQNFNTEDCNLMRVAPSLTGSRPTLDGFCSLPYQVQPSQVFVCPADVREHRFEGADRKCVAEPMVRHHYSPPIRVTEHQVTPSRSG